MAKVGVLIRHLQGCRPVAMAVINPPDYELDNLENYFTSESISIKEKFIESFPEFQNADFYVDIVERT